MGHFDHIDYSAQPDHMRDGMRRYIEKGIEPGGFALACLTNDLVSAFARADDINLAAMSAWVRWLYYAGPAPAWGTKAKVAAWITSRALDPITDDARPAPVAAHEEVR